MIFQKMILIVATIILIVLLVVIGIILSKAGSNNQWVPIVGECPDYWVDMSGNGEACLNTHNLGRCNLTTNEQKNTMNFNVSPFNAENGTCSKYTWATRCGVTWDGITYGVNNPCQTTS